MKPPAKRLLMFRSVIEYEWRGKLNSGRSDVGCVLEQSVPSPSFIAHTQAAPKTD